MATLSPSSLKTFEETTEEESGLFTSPFNSNITRLNDYLLKIRYTNDIGGSVLSDRTHLRYSSSDGNYNPAVPD